MADLYLTEFLGLCLGSGSPGDILFPSQSESHEGKYSYYKVRRVKAPQLPCFCENMALPFVQLVQPEQPWMQF